MPLIEVFKQMKRLKNVKKNVIFIYTFVHETVTEKTHLKCGISVRFIPNDSSLYT